jgi:hypothetical protein
LLAQSKEQRHFTLQAVQASLQIEFASMLLAAQFGGISSIQAAMVVVVVVNVVGSGVITAAPSGNVGSAGPGR